MKTALVFLLLFCSTAVCQAQAGSSSAAPFVAGGPQLLLTEALAVAQEYVQAQEIDLSDQFIQLIQLAYDEGRYQRGNYWQIRWMWKMPRLGGEYGLRVYMDKRVIPERAGP